MQSTEAMRRHLERFTPAVDSLVHRFEDLVAQEKIRLGTLFNYADYPGIEVDGDELKLLASDELRSKFSFETKVLPLPDEGDFRVSLGDEEKTRIKRQITATVEASLQVACRELWQRLREAVAHMAERLQAYKVTDDGGEHPSAIPSLLT